MTSAAEIRRQVAVVRRELDVLEAMLGVTGAEEEQSANLRLAPVLNGARLMTAEDLRQACIDRAIPINVDDSIYERYAADLLSKRPKTLKGWRLTDGRLPSAKFAGKTAYHLADLADFLNSVAQTGP